MATQNVVMDWSYKRAMAIGVSAYELFACVSGRVPPITDIARRHPVVAGIIIGWCAYHFTPPVSKLTCD